MASVLPLATTSAPPAPVGLEEQLQRLENVLPSLVNDCAVMVHRPFRIEWDWFSPTASTDCRSVINLSPWFFIRGDEISPAGMPLQEVGFGSAYHECGHIRQSPYGPELIRRARAEGGRTREYIVQIMLDRKDDRLLADDMPGFAETLRRRLFHICTMTRQESLEALCQRLQGTDRGANLALAMSNAADWRRVLKHWKPGDAYEDFFLAAKWHRRHRFPATKRALDLLTRKELADASVAKLLWIAKKIHKILGEPPDHPEQSQSNEAAFIELMVLFAEAEAGGTQPIPSPLLQGLQQMMQRYVQGQRNLRRNELLRSLSKPQGYTNRQPLSTGTTEHVPVRQVPPGAQHAARNAEYEAEVLPFVEPLLRELRALDRPSSWKLGHVEEGELDLDNTSGIALGRQDVYYEMVDERDVDAELHLAIDCSGSMTGDKLRQAKLIAAVFSSALTILNPSAIGRIWAFSSRSIYDYGPPGGTNAYVTASGEEANSDTHMLRHVGNHLLTRSRKRRKILIALCDDGPDDIDETRRLSRQLEARGVIPVSLLIGVHSAPGIYPHELIFDNMGECLHEFAELLTAIIKHLR